MTKEGMLEDPDLSFGEKDIVVPPQKPPSTIPKPADRPPQWIKYQDLVAFVIIDKKGKPRMRTGHITSWPGSHGGGHEVDNAKHTIVWCDQVVNELSDNADDAYEKGFDPKDPCLIRMDEIEILKNPDTAALWFQGVYSPEIAQQISVLVSTSDLGRESELKEQSEEWKRAGEAAKKKMGWWDLEHGVFYSPTAKTP